MPASQAKRLSYRAMLSQRRAERQRNQRREVKLPSVLGLLGEAKAAVHPALQAIVREHTFVGVVDEQLSLVQHKTRLVLVNHYEYL